MKIVSVHVIPGLGHDRDRVVVVTRDDDGHRIGYDVDVEHEQVVRRAPARTAADVAALVDPELPKPPGPHHEVPTEPKPVFPKGDGDRFRALIRRVWAVYLDATEDFRRAGAHSGAGKHG